jgi:glycosyltransferase involved in cell wall biosynthesis
MPIVSVIITCYNLGGYLQEAIDSIPASLGGSATEVIIVDDGSTDPLTRKLLEGIDRTRYIVLEQANTGLGKARNNGIARASGTYIIPLDADNRLNSAGVEQAVTLLEARPEVDIVYGHATYFGERNGPWIVGEYDFRRLLRKNYIDACACFRRSLWERIGGYDEHMPHMGWEDWDLWLRASAAGMSFHHLGSVFFHYRVRQGSMIEGTNAHAEELTAYIFNKPALRFLDRLRADYMHLREEANNSLGVRGALKLAADRLLRSRKN